MAQVASFRRVSVEAIGSLVFSLEAMKLCGSGLARMSSTKRSFHRFDAVLERNVWSADMTVKVEARSES
jgi:hypothetical protein